MFALDERLRLHGLAPVFEAERVEHEHEHDEPRARPSRRRAVSRKSRPQRSLPLRQRQEIQEVPRRVTLSRVQLVE